MDTRWIEDGQRVALMRLLECRGGLAGKGQWLLSRILGREIDVTTLTRADWQQVRDMAFLDWRNDEWEVSDWFKARLSALDREYLEVVLGQGNLFG